MRQLVGLNCAICSQRIGSDLEAGFCKQCENPVHFDCRQSRGTADLGACSICGTDHAAAAIRQAEERRQAEVARSLLPPPPPLALQNVNQLRHVYRVGKFVVGGLVVFVMGCGLLASGETGAGIGALFASIGFGAIAWFLSKKR